MYGKWTSSGSFLLIKSDICQSQSVVTLYSVNTSERNSIPDLVYRHDFATDEFDRELIEREVQRRAFEFRTEKTTSNYELISASVGVRPATGEPVIAIFGRRRIPIQKRIVNSWIDMLKNRILHPLTNVQNDTIIQALFYQLEIQIINPRTCCLDVELTQVANGLVKGSNFFVRAMSKDDFEFSRFIEYGWFQNYDEMQTVSSDCQKILYFNFLITRTNVFQYHLLDLSKGNVRKLEICEPKDMKWAEDSRLFGLCFYSAEIQDNKFRTRLYDCKSLTANMEVTVTPLPGRLLCLQWISSNYYNVYLIENSRFIDIYELSLIPGELTIPQLMFKVRFCPAPIEERKFLSMCFDRFREQYSFVMSYQYGGSIDACYAFKPPYFIQMHYYAISLQKPKISTHRLPEQAGSSSDSTNSILSIVHLNFDPQKDTFPHLTVNDSGLITVNPVCPLIVFPLRASSSTTSNAQDCLQKVRIRLSFLETISSATKNGGRKVAVREGNVATLAEIAWRTLYSSSGARALECAIRQKRVQEKLLKTSLRWNPYTLGPHCSEWLQ